MIRAVVPRLETLVEEAKHTLSLRDRTEIHLEYSGQTCDVPVTRAVFEELTADLLERAAQLVRQLFAAGSRFAWRDVGQLLLVGGRHAHADGRPHAERTVRPRASV